MEFFFEGNAGSRGDGQDNAKLSNLAKYYFGTDFRENTNQPLCLIDESGALGFLSCERAGYPDVAAGVSEGLRNWRTENLPWAVEAIPNVTGS